MNNLTKILVLLFAISVTEAFAKYSYKSYNNNGHIIYQVDFSTDEYDLELVKALDDGKLGVENLYSIGKRQGAVVAVNGGYFQSHGSNNGVPYGFLLSPSLDFIPSYSLPVFYVSNNGKINFDEVKAVIQVSVADSSANVATLNIPQASGITIYTSRYWTSTLSAQGTKEIIVKDNRVAEVNNRGNNKIPEYGYVISFNSKSSEGQLRKVNVGMHSNFKYILKGKNHELRKDQYRYLLSGSHILVNNFKVNNTSSLKHFSDFNSSLHARTALCQMSDNKYSFYIVDHNPELDLMNLPLKDIINPIKNRLNLDRSSILKMSSEELMSQYTNIRSSKSSSLGFKLSDFAKFLESKGCMNAINLDGGGSSTMLIENKIVNNPSTLNGVDIEGKTLREVGDAIILKKSRGHSAYIPEPVVYDKSPTKYLPETSKKEIITKDVSPRIDYKDNISIKKRDIIDQEKYFFE